MIQTKDSQATTTFMYIIFVTLAFIFSFPLIFMVMASFKPDPQIFSDLHSLRAFLPVGDISLQHYRQVFAKTDVALYFTNSLLVTGLTVGSGLIVNSMMAYALARLEWSMKKVVLGLVIALLIIPFETIAVPLLLLVSKMPWLTFEAGQLTFDQTWLNTLRVQIFPFVGDAFSIFLFYQFFLDIPKDFDEAAYIDGSNPWQIYYKIILPMAKPVFATVAILKFLLMWNQYLWPIMSVQGELARPVMPGLQQFFGQKTSWGEVMAYATMITFPVIMVFLIFQKWFVRSVAGAGVKG